MLLLHLGQKTLRYLCSLFNFNNGRNSSIDNLLVIAKKIEELAPVGGKNNKENPEYPWKDNLGNIQTPSKYNFPVFSPIDIIKIQKIVSSLFVTAKSF